MNDFHQAHTEEQEVGIKIHPKELYVAMKRNTKKYIKLIEKSKTLGYEPS